MFRVWAGCDLSEELNEFQVHGPTTVVGAYETGNHPAAVEDAGAWTGRTRILIGPDNFQSTVQLSKARHTSMYESGLSTSSVLSDARSLRPI